MNKYSHIPNKPSSCYSILKLLLMEKRHLSLKLTQLDHKVQTDTQIVLVQPHQDKSKVHTEIDR